MTTGGGIDVTIPFKNQMGPAGAAETAGDARGLVSLFDRRCPRDPSGSRAPPGARCGTWCWWECG